LDAITPSRFICPKTFQLSPLQTVFIQGIVRIDFLEEKNLASSPISKMNH
jgi:hypothetical protein